MTIGSHFKLCPFNMLICVYSLAFSYFWHNTRFQTRTFSAAALESPFLQALVPLGKNGTWVSVLGIRCAQYYWNVLECMSSPIPLHCHGINSNHPLSIIVTSFPTARSLVLVFYKACTSIFSLGICKKWYRNH